MAVIVSRRSALHLSRISLVCNSNNLEVSPAHLLHSDRACSFGAPGNPGGQVSLQSVPRSMQCKADDTQGCTGHGMSALLADLQELLEILSIFSEASSGKSSVLVSSSSSQSFQLAQARAISA